VVLYHRKVNNPDLIWGYATLDLLGPLNIGLVGLMIACLMAALMSTADCMMITASSLLTHNIYRPLIKDKSEHHYVTVGRVAGGLVVIGGALIATQFDTILQQLKFWWELNVMVAAAFWVGMKWRRATRPAAWASMVVTMVIFFLLPMTLPNLMPALRTDESLLKMTEARVISREYAVTQMDAEASADALVKWNMSKVGEKPEALKVGDTYSRAYTQASRSVFWTKGIKVNGDGGKQGSGMLSLELVLLDRLGYDLGKHPYAYNETIRILIRTIVPFLILILVSLLTRRDDKAMLDRFFVKMKTPVESEPDEDERQLKLSYADPRRFDDQNMFGPGSDLEFNKWNRTDAVGFLLSCLAAAAVVLLLVGLISLGG
jgi:SSS family solute:Na+ symporter